MWPTLLFWFTLNAAAIALVLVLRAVMKRRTAQAELDAEPAPRFDSREDMIFIWTEIHGIPREKAESMYEEYVRAATVASLGLKGK